jgi:hypothetical protein
MEEASVILEMLDGLEADHAVERIIGQRQWGDLGPDESSPTASLCSANRGLVGIDAGYGSHLGQKLRTVAGATCNVQDRARVE